MRQNFLQIFAKIFNESIIIWFIKIINRTIDQTLKKIYFMTRIETVEKSKSTSEIFSILRSFARWADYRRCLHCYYAEYPKKISNNLLFTRQTRWIKIVESFSSLARLSAAELNLICQT